MKIIKPINLILASTRKMGIGYKNDIPWPFLKQDMIHFNKTTKKCADNKKQNAVVMAFKTFESLNFTPLPKRQNFVISRKSGEKLSKFANKKVKFFG